MFVLEHSVKLASLTVLACISIERYLTIRKPFCTEVRKRFVRLTPIIALFFASSGITTLLIQLPSVYVSTDSLNCVVSFRNRLAPRLASVFSSCFFLIGLSAISLNYFQIIRHVKRKFSKRKARGNIIIIIMHSLLTSQNQKVAEAIVQLQISRGNLITWNLVVATRQRESLISQPRYMSQMTSAIVRVGVFHFVAWLPFCLLRLWPSSTLHSELSAHVRLFHNFTDFSALRWVIFIANWLTYANAAGDWIFYAAMNKELRNLIRYIFKIGLKLMNISCETFRFATERRKRSTMTHVASPSNTHRSFKQQTLQRVIQSISYRSSVGASQDDPEKANSQDQPSPQIVHSALLSTPSEPEFV
ncbi:hypothetical protein WR25_00091 isoform E [Diploscapter pachys]|nr:hypothetical protein WR25_00091 isoform E [Diploscapter pachys]